MKYCMHCMNEIEDNIEICSKCGNPTSTEVPAHHLPLGTILNKKFMVGEAIGEGGFGITYIGRDLQLDMKVAIKEYYPNGYVNRSNTISADVTCSTSQQRKEFFEKGRQRFINEAKVLARFAGEQGVVCVREFFEENSTAYIVMEYLEGMDLKEYIKQKGRIDAEEIIRLLLPVMNSLNKIHQQGLIHRDISPDNIRLINGGVKLIDFGATRDMSSVANKSLSVMLKPGYAPEEQYRSKGDQGPWTDVYALSATLYKCITGITPDDATQRLYQDEVKTPSALGIKIDKNIEFAIMKGMAVLQKDRYQSIDEMIDGINGINTIASNDSITADYSNVKKDNKNTHKKKDVKKIVIVVGVSIIVGIICLISMKSNSNTEKIEQEESMTDEEMIEDVVSKFMNAMINHNPERASKYYITDLKDVVDEEDYIYLDGEKLYIEEDKIEIEMIFSMEYEKINIKKSSLEDLKLAVSVDDAEKDSEIINKKSKDISDVYVYTMQYKTKYKVENIEYDESYYNEDYLEYFEEEQGMGFEEYLIKEYEQESYNSRAANMYVGKIDGEWKVLYFQ